MLAFRNLLQPSLLRGAAPAAAAALASLRGAALGAPASSADATPAAAPGGGLLPLRQHLQAAGLRTGGAALASLQVKVPPLGESITDGSVAAILKAPGDRVEEDEVIIQVETDKVTIDVRSPRAGTVEAILVSGGGADRAEWGGSGPYPSRRRAERPELKLTGTAPCACR